jgi:hypothetical protein
MQPIEKYLERSDELAQEVVNAWGTNMRAGNADFLTDDFKALFDKACRYRNAKSTADNRRQFGALNERDAAEEAIERQAFGEAYKSYWEKHQAAA